MSIDKKEFKEKLKKWVKCEQEIKKFNNTIREYKKIKDELAPDIMDYMEKKNKELLSINSAYQIKYNKTNTFQSVNKNYISKKIGEYLKNSEESQKITDFIYDQREKKDRETLTIIKKKK